MLKEGLKESFSIIAWCPWFTLKSNAMVAWKAQSTFPLVADFLKNKYVEQIL